MSSGSLLLPVDQRFVENEELMKTDQRIDSSLLHMRVVELR